MKALIQEIREALAELRRWQVWATIFLIAGFAGMAFLVAFWAMRTDSVLSFMHLTYGYCPTLNNTTIIALFAGMIFFILAAILTLGEVQRLFEMRRQKHFDAAQQALRWAMIWGGGALTITLSALYYFKTNCF